MVKILCPDHVSVCMSDYPVTVCCLIGDHRPCVLDKEPVNMELSRQKKQLEEQRDQLISLSKQLEEATHAKLVFFTNVSHDFRTPLTLVADPVEQLLEDKDLTSKQRSLLKVVHKNVNILLRLVNQILDFRKYEMVNWSW